MNNKLGEFIRAKRGSMSLREFAKNCGISHTTLDNIEKGIDFRTGKPVSINLDTLLGLSRGAGVDPAELVNLVFDDEAANKSSRLDVDWARTEAIDETVPLPIYGVVKAGPGGLAYREYLGEEKADLKSKSDSSCHFWLKVQGDSMTGDGIMNGDLALVRVQSDADNGSVVVAIVDGEEGTIKRLYKDNGTIILQSSNPAYPPRIVSGKSLEEFHIIGVVKEIKRKL